MADWCHDVSRRSARIIRWGSNASALRSKTNCKGLNTVFKTTAGTEYPVPAMFSKSILSVYTIVTLFAHGPFLPSPTSNSTACPSLSDA